jgi:hypothetical protein
LNKDEHNERQRSLKEENNFKRYIECERIELLEVNIKLIENNIEDAKEL